MTWWRKNGERFNIERLKGERLNEEMQAHIDFETQDNIEAGMPPEAARQAAMRKLATSCWREKNRAKSGAGYGRSGCGRTFATLYGA
jgi:hypothetical protein